MSRRNRRRKANRSPESYIGRDPERRGDAKRPVEREERLDRPGGAEDDGQAVGGHEAVDQPPPEQDFARSTAVRTGAERPSQLGGLWLLQGPPACSVGTATATPDLFRRLHGEHRRVAWRATRAGVQTDATEAGLSSTAQTPRGSHEPRGVLALAHHAPITAAVSVAGCPASLRVVAALLPRLSLGFSSGVREIALRVRATLGAESAPVG
jgi:hypothetical protein